MSKESMKPDVSLGAILKKGVSALAVMGALSLLSACQRATPPIPPEPKNANVLLITLDTTRADHLGCYAKQGSAKASPSPAAPSVETPNLDALANRGVLFLHDTAEEPLTLPSHACLMTGSYPEVNGMRDMGGFILGESHPTIASVVRAAGYQTGAFVGSAVLARGFGISNGFETYDDNMGVEKNKEEAPLPGIFPERRASVVTDHALEWLGQHYQKRFFLWAHYFDPHAPYNPPEPYKHAYARDLYSGEVAYMDAQVGRLLDGLKSLGIESRTLVVATGDHGESLGEHGELTHGIFLYDSTLHVPLIIAGPGVPARKVISEQVREIDLMPTILAFLKLSPGSEAQGVSLWPLIDRGFKVHSNYAYLETLYPRTYMGWSELRGIRTDNWKFVLAPHPELYDLTADPGERSNVIARQPILAQRLEAQMWRAIKANGPQERVISSPVDEQTRQDLESLGYIGAGTPRVVELGTRAPDPKDHVDMLKLLDAVTEALDHHQSAHAATLMEKGLKGDPGNPLAHIYLARAFEDQGNYARAIQVYEQAIQKNITTEQIYARLGRDNLRLQRFPEAVQAMNRAREINATDLDNMRNLATAQLQMGKVDEAKKAFQAITLQNDQYAAAWNGLGLVAIRQGDPKTAERNFKRAIELGPNEVEPLLNLGLLYQKTGRGGEAIRYYTKFLNQASRREYGQMFAEVRAAIQSLKGR